MTSFSKSIKGQKQPRSWSPPYVRYTGIAIEYPFRCNVAHLMGRDGKAEMFDRCPLELKGQPSRSAATSMPLKQSVEINLMRAGLGQMVSQHHAVRTKAVPMRSYAVSRM
jgi:hypothetical protein